MARFTFDEAVDFLSNKRSDVARREDWGYDDIIRMDGEKFLRGDEVVELSDEDRAADDWIVYRQA